MRVWRMKKQRNGAILALMMVVVLLLSMASLAIIGIGQQARLRTVRRTAEVAARFAADAGIERVLYQMNQKLAAGTWTLDDVPLYNAQPLIGCDADYTVAFTGNLAGGYHVTSTGHCGGRTRTVRVTLLLTNPFAQDYAVLSRSSIAFKSKSRVGGYNSADPLDTDVAARIGTFSTADGAIDIYNGSTVDADVVVGPGGDPQEVVNLHGGSVEREYFVMPVPLQLPVIEAPDYTASRGPLSVKNNVELLASDSGKYTSIAVAKGKTLTIGGDLKLYVTGKIDLGSAAKIEVKEAASLDLYFDGDLDAKNSAGICNASRVPSRVKLFGTGSNQKIDLKNDGALYGVVYAPEADMTVHNEADVYGSVIVNRFELKNGGDVCYDKALKEVSLEDKGVRFAVTQWEEL
ncbi:MAG: hypothetical protein L0Y36_04010 [Planctomycetales bacterium]|nr:hypothetical protein [Planctomycetales bacterium]